MELTQGLIRAGVNRVLVVSVGTQARSLEHHMNHMPATQTLRLVAGPCTSERPLNYCNSTLNPKS